MYCIARADCFHGRWGHFLAPSTHYDDWHLVYRIWKVDICTRETLFERPLSTQDDFHD